MDSAGTGVRSVQYAIVHHALVTLCTYVHESYQYFQPLAKKMLHQ